MCGIFGVVGPADPSGARILRRLASAARRRGRDSSGLLFATPGGEYQCWRADYGIESLLPETNLTSASLVVGHSRLITNGVSDNQPVVREGVCVIHNGIVVNADELWKKNTLTRHQEIDTEIIAALTADLVARGAGLAEVAAHVADRCFGTVSCAILVPALGKMLLFTNNGSLYVGFRNGALFFFSEAHALTKAGCEDVNQVNGALVVDIPASTAEVQFHDRKRRTTNLIPSLGDSSEEEKSLQYFRHNLRRCTRCILPQTMPFIRFDDEGVCNYCASYRPTRKLKSRQKFMDLLDRYRGPSGIPCLVPFSGGRDSSYALHVITKELGIKPITMTYDWGMVTDLARRNISRMCSRLGVENIIVADDIEKKRGYIATNLKAWLRSPHLGMLNILMAGDKHFFRHMESVKQETGIELNLWGMNPLEVTHFKAGFLGFPPDFEHDQVFYTGLSKQIRYQYLRFREMFRNPSYLNRTLWDTLSGEYYRSIKKKSGFHNIFDYWEWDEKVINDTLDQYQWERAPDTRSTWRIGDGTAAFYNYVYYTVAGFSEYDTFRSNQIREGALHRSEALKLVNEENAPRYPNIKWYLDAVGLDFREVVGVINAIPKMYTPVDQ